MLFRSSDEDVNKFFNDTEASSELLGNSNKNLNYEVIIPLNNPTETLVELDIDREKYDFYDDQIGPKYPNQRKYKQKIRDQSLVQNTAIEIDGNNIELTNKAVITLIQCLMYDNTLHLDIETRSIIKSLISIYTYSLDSICPTYKNLNLQIFKACNKIPDNKLKKLFKGIYFNESLPKMGKLCLYILIKVNNELFSH